MKIRIKTEIVDGSLNAGDIIDVFDTCGEGEGAMYLVLDPETGEELLFYAREVEVLAAEGAIK